MTKDERKRAIELKTEQIVRLKKEIEALELSQYPCVKAAKHFDKKQIVLFTAPKTGVNINGVGWPYGHKSGVWDEKYFEPFTGSIEYKDGKSVDGKDYYE